jgi:hypothetical protein
VRPLIRLPRSASRRNALEGAQLIRRIVRGRRGAFRIDGWWLKPGKVVSEQSLWPGPDWPSVPHLLEIFPSVSSVGGHGGSRIDVVLWRWIKAQHEWRDVCALRGQDSAAWMNELEPILARSLERARAHIAPPDMRAVAKRIVDTLDQELRELGGPDEREALFTELWVQLGYRVCSDQDDDLGPLGIPVGG